MNKYEVLYIINTQLDDEARAAAIEKFNGIIAANGGTVDSVDEWGRRKLAYLIEDMSDGYYVLVKFTAPPELPMELERNMKITDSVMRYMVTRLAD